MSGYSTIPRNFSRKQRKSFNKKLREQKALNGEKWLSLEELRELRKNHKEKAALEAEKLKNIEKLKRSNDEKIIDSGVFKSLSLETKIAIIRKNLCKHMLVPEHCINCIEKLKRTFKIPKLNKQ